MGDCLIGVYQNMEVLPEVLVVFDCREDLLLLWILLILIDQEVNEFFVVIERIILIGFVAVALGDIGLDAEWLLCLLELLAVIDEIILLFLDEKLEAV